MRKTALLVAVDTYADARLNALKAPSSDAERLAEVLRHPKIGGFDVQILRNRSSGEVMEALEETLVEAARDDLVLIHFAGHGLKDSSGELYLAAVNSVPDRLGSTAVHALWVSRYMHRSRSRRIVLLLDCCYGGAFVRGLIARSGDQVDVVSPFVSERPDAGQGRAVITASSATEFAFEAGTLAEDSTRGGSVFTQSLIEGLASGEADLDHDGEITLDELYDYVYRQVREKSRDQTPGKWTFGFEGRLLIAHSRHSESGVHVALESLTSMFAQSPNSAPAQFTGEKPPRPMRQSLLSRRRLWEQLALLRGWVVKDLRSLSLRVSPGERYIAPLDRWDAWLGARRRAGDGRLRTRLAVHCLRVVAIGTLVATMFYLPRAIADRGEQQTSVIHRSEVFAMAGPWHLAIRGVSCDVELFQSLDDGGGRSAGWYDRSGDKSSAEGVLQAQKGKYFFVKGKKSEACVVVPTLGLAGASTVATSGEVGVGRQDSQVIDTGNKPIQVNAKVVDGNADSQCGVLVNNVNGKKIAEKYGKPVDLRVASPPKKVYLTLTTPGCSAKVGPATVNDR